MRRFFAKRYLVIAGIIIALFFTVNVVKANINDSALYDALSLFSETISIIKHNYVNSFDVKKIMYGAMRGMLEDLDEYSQFLTPEEYEELNVETEGRFGGIGIVITLRDGVLTVISPLEGTPAWQAGIKAMDRILSINGKSTKDFSLSKATELLRGEPGSEVSLKILRETEEKLLDFKITRNVIRVKSVKDASVIDGVIGYVKLIEFQETTPKELAQALRSLREKHVKALILDLRNNPGGVLEASISVAGYFLEKDGLVVFTKGRSPEDCVEFRTSQQPIFADEPLAVLINGGSASAAEIVAAALKEHGRATLFGTNSFGKGSVQTVFPLEDGSAIKLTTAVYYSPSGKAIRKDGVSCDVTVPSAQELLAARKKEPFRDAFESIEKKDTERKEEYGRQFSDETLEKFVKDGVDLPLKEAKEFLKKACAQAQQ